MPANDLYYPSNSSLCRSTLPFQFDPFDCNLFRSSFGVIFFGSIGQTWSQHRFVSSFAHTNVHFKLVGSGRYLIRLLTFSAATGGFDWGAAGSGALCLELGMLVLPSHPRAETGPAKQAPTFPDPDDFLNFTRHHDLCTAQLQWVIRSELYHQGNNPPLFPLQNFKGSSDCPSNLTDRTQNIGLP